MNTNKYTIVYKGKKIDLRKRRISELNALRTLISRDIKDIGNQLDEYDEGTLRYKGTRWYRKAEFVMEKHGESLEKVREHLQGRANNEKDYTYIGVINEFEERIRQALTDVIPDNAIELVIDRIYEQSR